MAMPKKIAHPDEGWVAHTLTSLSLEEKVGQVLCINLRSFQNQSEKIIETLKPGGVTLQPGTPRHATEQLNHLQMISALPLLVVASFEKGVGTFIEGATEFPPAMGVGATRNPDFARLQGRITGLESRAIGVHVAFAPVCDINTVPLNPIINVRSFSEEPRVVARMAEAWLDGAHEAGLIGTIKHFPGQGSTTIDTHKSLAEVPGSIEELRKKDLYPFEQLFNSGKVHSLMTAHIWMPALDKIKRPVTLSPLVINGWLRRRYDGVVFTDAMDMGGVVGEKSAEKAIVEALEAGCDVILIPPNPVRARDAILNALNTGRLSLQRLDEAVTRILRLKAMANLHQRRTIDEDRVEACVGIEEHRRAAFDMARASVTVAINRNKILPLDKTIKAAVIGMVNKKGQLMVWRDNYSFGKIAKRQGKGVRSLFLGDRCTPASVNKALQLARSADVIVLALYPRILIAKGDIQLHPAQMRLITSLKRLNKPIVAISFGNPYIINDLPEVDAFICSYGNAEQILEATSEILFGTVKARGILPVTINKNLPYGTGIVQ